MQDNLILLLKKNNLTHRWLAEFLNVSDKQISRKLNGEAPFKSDEMFKVANYFNKSIDEIFLPRMYENGTF